jgi:hypothetical protein
MLLTNPQVYIPGVIDKVRSVRIDPNLNVIQKKINRQFEQAELMERVSVLLVNSMNKELQARLERSISEEKTTLKEIINPVKNKKDKGIAEIERRFGTDLELFRKTLNRLNSKYQEIIDQTLATQKLYPQTILGMLKLIKAMDEKIENYKDLFLVRQIFIELKAGYSL